MTRGARDQRARYAMLKAAGLCPRCKGKPQPGRVCCRGCTVAIVAWRAINKRRREQEAA